MTPTGRRLAGLIVLAVAGLATAAEDASITELTLPLLGERRLASLSEYRGEKILLIQFASW